MLSEEHMSMVLLPLISVTSLSSHDGHAFFVICMNELSECSKQSDAVVAVLILPIWISRSPA